MALPIANTPKYKLTIPSTNKIVTYRPFLVKEEKALMIAQQSEDSETMLATLKFVIESCIIDTIDANSFAMFDIEYIFTQLRAKSVGEIVDLVLKCDSCDDEKATVQYSIDLTKLKVDFPKGHTKTIELFGDVGVIMKYPSLDLLNKINSLNSEDVEGVFSIICSCIEAIYNNQELFYAKDVRKDEIYDFVNNLTQEQFKKLQQFFETMPKLEQHVQYSCPICKKEHEKFIKGLESFF